jgi:hypothetical protein
MLRAIIRMLISISDQACSAFTGAPAAHDLNCD